MIEVTSETFYKLFTDIEPSRIEKKELAYREHYFNADIGQGAIVIFNYISAVNQYYLIDINK